MGNKIFAFMGFWEYKDILNDALRGAKWFDNLLKFEYTGWTEALLRHNKLKLGCIQAFTEIIFSFKNTKKVFLPSLLKYWKDHLLQISILFVLNIIVFQNVH